jgi:hypothetical protein
MAYLLVNRYFGQVTHGTSLFVEETFQVGSQYWSGEQSAVTSFFYKTIYVLGH